MASGGEPLHRLLVIVRMTPPSLWHHPAFRKLWLAQTLSFFGSQVTLLAIPLTAVIVLNASAAQMGVLRSAATLPALLVGLFVGVWVDRLRRRPLLIGADLGRAVLLVSIPAVVVADRLTVSLLYVVAFLIGLLTTVFDVAHPSYLPALIPRAQIVDGNSKLEASRAASLVAGPGVAGALVQLVTAPIAILVDAASYLVSALLLALIPANEQPKRAPERDRGVLKAIGEGLEIVGHSRNLRSMAASLAVFNFFFGVLNAIYLLYLVRNLGFEPGAIGLLFSVGSLGFPFGALLAGVAARRIGMGPAIVWGAVISDAAFLLVPLASGPRALVLLLLIVAQMVATIGGPITAINQLSLRQSITPDHFLGRVNATMHVVALGPASLGALLGGWLGATIGLRPTLALGALGLQLGALIMVLSPVRRFRQPAVDAA